MKKSKIFLGISTLTLVVASTFATQKIKTTIAYGYYLTQITSGSCVLYGVCLCSPYGPGGLCTVIINSTHYALYTSNCNLLLYTGSQ